MPGSEGEVREGPDGGEGDDKRTDVFLDNKNRLFRYEMEYDREMSPDVERTRRQQDLPAMEAMINLRANLLQESKSGGGGGGAEKLLYAESLELSSQVLEGSLHLL